MFPPGQQSRLLHQAEQTLKGKKYASLLVVAAETAVIHCDESVERQSVRRTVLKPALMHLSGGSQNSAPDRLPFDTFHRNESLRFSED